ncbi:MULTISPECIES: bifunctional NAD(P)/FAD-dependent oxidoreductase/class I SAM-dependent methyltransferase [unclassified Microbacterium]|uniref:bifunctional NAD(P)/FAD-dependent oxidoreductase/class I SAM-dependent methyltransferase n=1 Tax=unclassified Microbacterium TaxID=2609290 RepID=UPI000C2B96B9|nr:MULTISPECIES: bifunctional NAD(P)/FAD-dependent oxidoreductase/class I SAM-dependent methyltransferase [unclassified Microbacterium]
MHNHVTASASEPWDTIIIGGGVAGLSAALMLGRARRRVLVIDAGQPRNRFASHMHAVLGHEGIDPAELLRIGRADASAIGVEFMDASVTRVDDSGEPDPGDLTVTTDDGTSYAARTLIVATGITDRLPDIPGLAERWGTSVLHCPYCHGWEVRDRRLGVLATSPMALHQVQLLRQWSNDVVLFAGLVPTLDAPTRTRLGARGIRIVDQAVVEVLGSGNTLTGVRLEDGTVVEIDAIFTGGAPEPHDRMLEAWSGRVNATLEAIARDLEPGRALDLGCGEGGDAIWLAENGWHATGVDLSPTAIDRARTAATARGLTARTTFVVSDLSTYTDTDTGTDPDAKTDDYDLVTASFLQSPVHLPREQILRAATELVALHGRLLIVGHAAPPAWAPPEHMRAVVFPTPEGDLAALHLDPTRWQTLVCEVRERAATAPDGSQAVLLDSVVLVQRTS